MNARHDGFLDDPPAGWTFDRLKDVSAINASSLPANTAPDYEFDYLEISNVNYHGIVDPKAIERLRYEDRTFAGTSAVGAELHGDFFRETESASCGFHRRYAGRFRMFHRFQCSATGFA